MSQTSTAKEKLIAFLQDYHDAVFACEASAKKALESGDQDAYRQHMREKAERMSRISQEAAPCFEGLDEPWVAGCKKQLKRFSNSANMGLHLNSPFYWSALLWDEEAAPEEPDNLQKLVDSLKNSAC